MWRKRSLPADLPTLIDLYYVVYITIIICFNVKGIIICSYFVVFVKWGVGRWGDFNYFLYKR